MNLNFKYELDNFTPQTEKLLIEAIEFFKNIYIRYHDDLKAKILNHKKRDGTLGFDQTDETNQQVYEKFFNEDAVHIQFIANYKRVGVARAYTYPNSNKIFFRVNKIDFNNTADLVNTIAHEYAHKKGLTHSYNSSPVWPTTSPYGIGQMFEDLFRNATHEPEPPKVQKKSFFKKIFGRFF